MTTQASLFQRTLDLESLAGEWAASSVEECTQAFECWLEDALASSLLPIFENWLATHPHSEIYSLALDVCRKRHTMNKSFFTALRAVGVDGDFDRQQQHGPMYLQNTLRSAASASLQTMRPLAWRSFARLDSGNNRLCGNMVEPFTLGSLHQLPHLDLADIHRNTAVSMLDRLASGIHYAQHYQTDANNLIAAIDALDTLRRDKHQDTFNSIPAVFEALVSDARAFIASRMSPDKLSEEIELLDREFAVCVGELRNGTKVMAVKLVDANEICLEEGDTDWSNYAGLWLAFPMTGSAYAPLVCMKAPHDLSSNDPPVFRVEEHMHPHVSDNGEMCLGNDSAFAMMLWKAKNLLSLAELHHKALHCYEGDSAYWQIAPDPVGYCSQCDCNIWTDDDQYFDYRGDSFCLECFEEYVAECCVSGDYFRKDTMVLVDHGPSEDCYCHPDNYQMYLRDHPLPTDDDDELHEETEGQEEADDESDAPHETTEGTESNDNGNSSSAH